MPETFPKSGDSPRSARSFWQGAIAVGLLAAAGFGIGLSAEPHFADESAYYSQAYFADLLLRGERNHIAWLEYPAYDLPPLPKYLIGCALKAGGYRYPGPQSWRIWYWNTSSRFEPPGGLTVARIPSVVLGALACVSVYSLGACAFNLRSGFLAAALMIVNPLFRTHARRAMSDVPAEAFILLALALALSALSRLCRGQSGVLAWVTIPLAGVAAGLATLSKLNGALAVVVILAWSALTWFLRELPVVRRVSITLAALIIGAVSFATFAALNPFLTAHPRRVTDPEVRKIAALGFWGRCAWLVSHRVSVSEGQKNGRFTSYALSTPSEKIEVLAVQGFGRFGPLGPRRDDSRIRFDWKQDWGALVWLPCVLAGGLSAWKAGREQRTRGEPPAAWAILTYALVACVVVAAYLPLAWDRYFISIQAGSALLFAGLLGSLRGRSSVREASAIG